MNQTYLIPLGYDWLFELIFVIELAARSMTFIYVGPFDLEQEKLERFGKINLYLEGFLEMLINHE